MINQQIESFAASASTPLVGIDGIQQVAESETSMNNNQAPESQEDFEEDTLGDRAVEFEFREPFIISGYRRPGCSVKKCIRSLFQAHNETINVWSHIVVLFGFVFHCLPVFYKHSPLRDHFVYPLLSFAIGFSAMILMSINAHLFNCMSSKARHICFFLDYAAISTYTFTVGQSFFFYSRPTNMNSALINSPYIYLTISAAISLTATYFCCASRHSWIKYKFIIRTGSFIASWLFNTLPFTMRAMYCNCSIECNNPAYTYFKQQVMCFSIAAISNVIRIPERFIPGLFDFFGQSHHFLHILCSLGAIDAFVALELDMVARRELLTSPQMPMPTFANSIGLLLGVLLGNLMIVIWFAVHCPDKTMPDNSCKKLE